MKYVGIHLTICYRCLHGLLNPIDLEVKSERSRSWTNFGLRGDIMLCIALVAWFVVNWIYINIIQIKHLIPFTLE